MESKLAPPIVAIVGQTASGKSELAMKLALSHRGEIICADSRTIYKGMDIGTAKPSLDDQKLVPHHGLNLLEPDKSFSAAEFKQYATRVIHDVQSRGKVPFVAGGTGLYVNGLLYNFEFGGQVDPRVRQKIENTSLHQLQQEARELGIKEADVSYKNKRHLGRAVERGGIFYGQHPLPGNVLLIGIEVDKPTLEKRIELRVEQMLAGGFEEEVQKLLTKYAVSAPGLQAPGYKAFSEYINGKISLEEARNNFIQNDKKLAKRQRTWFKRNPDIVWVQSFEQTEKIVASFLRKFDTIGK